MSNHNNTAVDHDRARNLRNNASPYEKKLWVVLREAAKVKGLKFRRQQPIHPYIADFTCMKARLLIELDGDSHDMQQGYDRVRDKYLKQKDFSILRFTNQDVSKDVYGVAMMIVERAEMLIRNNSGQAGRHAPLPNPPHKGEGMPAVLLELDVSNA